MYLYRLDDIITLRMKQIGVILLGISNRMITSGLNNGRSKTGVVKISSAPKFS